MEVLQIGNQYNQIAIKSQKAIDKLKFEEAKTFSKEEIEKYQEFRKKEEEDFLTQFTKIVAKMNKDK